MTTRSAPYRHADGSNCWTKHCSRGSSAPTITGSPIPEELTSFMSEWAKPVKITNERTQASAFLHLLPAAGRLRQGAGGIPSESDRQRRYELQAELGKESSDTITHYMQYEYEKVNALLRGKQAWRDFVAQDRAEKVERFGERDWSEENLQLQAKTSIAKLDTALTKLSRILPPKLQLLYRYEFAPTGFSHADALTKFQPGQVIDAPSYTSTTPNPNLIVHMLNSDYHMKDKEMYVYEIVSNRGVNVFESNGFGGSTHMEQEVLIPRNSQYRVHRVFEAPYKTGHTAVEQEQLGYYGYRDNWKKPVTKKRLTIIQLIDVTNESSTTA